MSLDDDILRMLNEHRDVINVFRSRLQHFELGTLIPKELEKLAVSYARQRILCSYCEPELLMIADPNYYQEHKEQFTRINGQFYDSNIAFGHTLGIAPEQVRSFRFEGVRGMKFSVVGNGRHLDIVEIDAGTSEAYFQRLDDKERENFAIYYFNNIRPSERGHVNKFSELYIAFVSRNLKNYFVVQKIVRIK